MKITIRTGPGYHTLHDWHMSESVPFNRFYFPTDGKASYLSSDSEQLMYPGHLYILPANQYYRVVSNAFRVVYVDAFLTPPVSSHLTDIRFEDHPVLKGVLNIFLELLRTGKNLGALTDPLMTFTVEYLIQQKLLIPLGESVLSPALELADRQNGINVTVTGMAESCGMTRVSFTRRFTGVFGESPQDYLLRIRFQYAMRLLSSGQSVSDVALQLGYSDYKNFSAIFKKHFGITPHAYAETCQPPNDGDAQFPFFLPPPPIFYN